MTAVAPEAEVRLLSAFRRAATNVPAYRMLLDEHGVVPSQVVDAASFSRLCPLTSKDNTFNRFELDQICVAGGMRNLAGVLTSSGQGGRFSFGLSTREQASAGADFIDRGARRGVSDPRALDTRHQLPPDGRRVLVAGHDGRHDQRP